MDRFDAIEVPGATLRCEIVGGGAPLVVLHGGPGLGHGYLLPELADLLAPHRALVFYDQRASGHSSGAGDPGRITMPDFVADLEAVRSACGVERFELLGHSFGGLLGMHYALAHPDRVEAMVLVDSDPASHGEWVRFRSVIDSRRTADDLAALDALRTVPGWDRDPASLARYYQVFLRPYFANPDMAARLDLGLDEHVTANLASTGSRLHASLGAWELRDRLSCIRAPTLVISGSASIYPADATRSLAAGIPECTLEVLEGAGHFPWLEAPQAFLAAVRRFLT